MTDTTTAADTAAAPSPADLVFLDTETMGLDPAAPVWEFAAIRRAADGATTEAHCYIAHHPAGWLDDMPEPFAADYRARFDPDEALDEPAAAELVHRITAGAHIVGAVPSFDTERLAKLLRRNGREPAWHYHLIDVENLAAGYLAALGALPPPPWQSETLSRAVGVDPARFDRHTARGDVAWTIAQYDAVLGEPAIRLPTVGRNDPRRPDVTELRARQLVVHGLSQREHATDALGEAIDDTLADLGVDAADAYARALGLVFNSLDAAESAALAARIRAGIPPLLLKLEGTQAK